jgi:hypothetical protein
MCIYAYASGLQLEGRETLLIDRVELVLQAHNPVQETLMLNPRAMR